MATDAVSFATIFQVLDELISDLELHIEREAWPVARAEADQTWGIMRVMAKHLARSDKPSPSNDYQFWEYERRRKVAQSKIPDIF